jgi:hypothetical protein
MGISDGDIFDATVPHKAATTARCILGSDKTYGEATISRNKNPNFHLRSLIVARSILSMFNICVSAKVHQIDPVCPTCSSFCNIYTQLSPWKKNGANYVQWKHFVFEQLTFKIFITNPMRKSPS